MGKFSLGIATSTLGTKMYKKEVFVSEDMNWIQKDIEKQYNIIITSLNNIDAIMKKIISTGEMSKTTKDNLKG